MTGKKYTHIFFDLDNTLWDFRKNSRNAMLEAFNFFLPERTELDFDYFFESYSTHNEQLWEKYRKKEISKQDLKIQRFQLTFDDLNISGIDPLAMNDRYLAEMPAQTILVDGAADVLNYLRRKGYRLFIITNGFSEVQHQKLKLSGIDHYFEKVFISEEVKTPKPGREIFEYAITSANAPKSKSLMIGDDLDVDILGALDVGMAAIHFSPESAGGATETAVSKAQENCKSINALIDLYSVL